MSLELDLTNYFRSQNWRFIGLELSEIKFVCLENIYWRKLDFDIDSVSNITALPNTDETGGGMARTWLGFYNKGFE